MFNKNRLAWEIFLLEENPPPQVDFHRLSVIASLHSDIHLKSDREVKDYVFKQME